jgi:hypothetical protein
MTHTLTRTWITQACCRALRHMSMESWHLVWLSSHGKLTKPILYLLLTCDHAFARALAATTVQMEAVHDETAAIGVSACVHASRVI